jgi:hypothetical protein
VPGQKALARHRTGDRRWDNLLPPHLPLGEAERTAQLARLAALGFDWPAGAEAAAA